MSEKYFGIERDKLSPYFCLGCLIGKTEEQMSNRDIRYCVDCQPIVEEGYAQLGQHKQYLKQLYNQKIEALNSEDNQTYPQKEKEVLLHTNSKKPQLYQNLAEDRPKPNVGGRPKKDIPVSLIHKLSNEGLGIGRIEKALREEGQIISAMTIQRVLSGERN